MPIDDVGEGELVTSEVLRVLGVVPKEKPTVGPPVHLVLVPRTIGGSVFPKSSYSRSFVPRSGPICQRQRSGAGCGFLILGFSGLRVHHHRGRITIGFRFIRRCIQLSRLFCGAGFLNPLSIGVQQVFRLQCLGCKLEQTVLISRHRNNADLMKLNPLDSGSLKMKNASNAEGFENPFFDFDPHRFNIRRVRDHGLDSQADVVHLEVHDLSGHATNPVLVVHKDRRVHHEDLHVLFVEGVRVNDLAVPVFREGGGVAFDVEVFILLVFRLDRLEVEVPPEINLLGLHLHPSLTRELARICVCIWDVLGSSARRGLPSKWSRQPFCKAHRIGGHR